MPEPTVDFDELTDEQIELIRRTIARGASDDELALFIEQCRRTRLDPLARQIYAVRRKQWDSTTRSFVEQQVIQVSIDGFRLIADRTRKYAGQVGPWWCGTDGDWQEVWLKAEPPAAARVGVLRHDFTQPLFSTALYKSYVQTNSQGDPVSRWKTDPAGMLAKCAEALALRRAFPQELSGLYTGDEMGQADNGREPAQELIDGARLALEGVVRPELPTGAVVTIVPGQGVIAATPLPTVEPAQDLATGQPVDPTTGMPLSFEVGTLEGVAIVGAALQPGDAQFLATPPPVKKPEPAPKAPAPAPKPAAGPARQSTPATPAKQTPAASKKAAQAVRPFDPQQLKSAFDQAVKQIGEKGLLLGPDDYSIVDSALHNLSEYEQDVAHYLHYLTTFADLESLDEYVIVALLRLLKPSLVDPDGNGSSWVPAQEAVIEFARVAALVPVILPGQEAIAPANLADAMGVTSDSKGGKKYSELTLPEMTNRWNKLVEMLQHGVPDGELRHGYMYKKAALDLLIPWKTAQEQAKADKTGEPVKGAVQLSIS